MAETTLVIRAVDKVSGSLNNIDKRLGRLNQNVKNLDRGFGGLTAKIATVGAAIGSAFGIRKILAVSSEVEQLGVRFQFLFGSVEEGNKAFETLLDFASKVPFTLQEIQQGAGNLAVISDNAEELGKNLAIVGNVAAVSGIDFRTASEQIQRAFSGGIAAAEIFREKGVRALLGFQNGAKVTAEETVKRFEEVFGPGGKFENATLALANTFEGVLSMVNDKIFKFTLALGNQGGLLNFAKGILGAIDEILEEQFGSIEKFAEQAGQKFIQVVKEFAVGIARIGDIITPVFNFVATGINNLLDFVTALPPVVRDFGIIGFFLLGPKFKLITIIVASLFDKILDVVGFVFQGIQGFGNKLVEWYNGLREFFGADPIDFKFTFAGENIEDFKSKVKDGFGKINEEMGGSVETAGRLEMMTTNFFNKVDEVVGKQAELTKEINDTIAASKVEVTEAVKLDNAMADVVKKIQQQKESIEGLTVDQKVSLELEKLKIDELLGQVKVSDELKAAKKEQIADQIRENILLKERNAIEGKLQSLSGSLGPGILDKFDPQKARLESQQETLEKALELKEITEEEYLKARNALYKQYDKRLQQQQKEQVENVLKSVKDGTVATEDIENLSGKQRLELAKGLGMDLLQNLGKVNEKAFRIAKAAAIANAIVSTAQGVANALKTLPIPLNFLAAAAVAAQGFAQVAAIRSTQYTGPRAKGGPVSAGQAFLVGEEGPELFTPNAGGQIVPNNQLRQEPVQVVFNIQANDTRGFDDLITSRRGLIVNLINSALNEKGRSGVTA